MFVAASDIYKVLRSSNPNLQFLVENVEPHEHLQADKQRMQSLWGAPFVTINAGDWGSPSSRPRNLATNIVDITAIPLTQHSPPQWFLPHDVYCDRRMMRCIIASENTHYPPTVMDTATRKRCRLYVAESEVFQLWP